MLGHVGFEFHRGGGCGIYHPGRQLLPADPLGDLPIITETHDPFDGEHIIAGKRCAVFGFGIGFDRERQLELSPRQAIQRTG